MVTFAPVRRLESLAAESPTLQTYLREIAKFPRLDRDQERELAQRSRQLQDDQALAKLVEANLRFVVTYAKRYRRLGVPFLELIHEGNLGLIEAARRFNPERDDKFIRYAVWWVRQAMMHLLSESAPADALPTKVSGATWRFGRQVAALQAELEHTPSTQDISDGLEISEEDAQTLMRAHAEDVSLSDRLWTHGAGGDGADLADTLENAVTHEIEDDLTRDALVHDLEVAMEELEPKERQVMRLRYGLHDDEPWSLQQIGERMRLSRDRIRQIETRAMQKLRRRKNMRSYLN